MPPEVLDAEIVEQPVSLRDTIESAVDEHAPEGETASPAKPSTPAPVVQKSPAPAPGTAPDKVSPTPVGTTAAPPAAASATTGAPASGTAAPTELKAPSQWKPQVREKWAQLPREVQEEIHRREGDNLRLLGTVGPKIKFANDVSSMLQPFSERLQAGNVPPEAFVADVFQTVRLLAHGSMQEKVDTVANILQSYRIDLAMLDQVLAHRLKAPPPSPEVMEARRIAAQAQQVLQRDQQGRVTQASERAESELKTFGEDPKNEFFPDVRDLMADLMESGQAKDLQSAYDSAIWAHADTRKILLQREAQQRLTNRTNRANQARTASASVHGSPRFEGNQGLKPGASLRETIADAIDLHSS